MSFEVAAHIARRAVRIRLHSNASVRRGGTATRYIVRATFHAPEVKAAGTSGLRDQRYRSRTRSASGTPSASAISLAVVMLGENHPASSSPRYLGSMAVAWLLPRDTAGICAATSSRVRF